VYSPQEAVDVGILLELTIHEKSRNTRTRTVSFSTL
jgi:hypothetical protein